MSSDLLKIQLKPTKTLEVEQGNPLAIQLASPSGEIFAIVNKNGDVTVYENLEARHKFCVGRLPLDSSLFSFAIHPSKELFAVAQEPVRGEKQPASVSLYNLEGEVIHFQPPITGEGFGCPAVGFDEQGNFFLATETEGTMALYAWEKNQPVTDYADLSLAAAYHRFEYSWNGALFSPSYQPGRSLLELICGHGGTTDYHWFRFKGGKLCMEAPVKNLSLGVGFSSDRSEFISSWHDHGKSLESQKYNLNKPLQPETTSSPIKFEKIGQPLPWPGYAPHLDDQDYPCREFFYLDLAWAVFPSDYGRMYAVDTRTMTLEGELAFEGCPQPKRLTRSGDYLMAVQDGFWSFVKIEEIIKSLDELDQ